MKLVQPRQDTMSVNKRPSEEALSIPSTNTFTCFNRHQQRGKKKNLRFLAHPTETFNSSKGEKKKKKKKNKDSDIDRIHASFPSYYF